MEVFFQPCIIHVEDVIDLPDTTYLMLELVEGGELFDLIIDSKKFPENIGKLHAYQMVSAINVSPASTVPKPVQTEIRRTKKIIILLYSNVSL